MQAPQLEIFSIDDLFVPRKKLQIGAIKAKTSGRRHYAFQIKEVLLKGVSEGFDIVIAPEYSFAPEHRFCYNKTEKEELVAELTKASDGVGLLVPGTVLWKQGLSFFNTCYVFSQGKLLVEYHKVTNSGESEEASRHFLEAQFGTNPSSFDWQGLKVGVEICADTGMLAKNRICDRDLTLLVSCGISSGAYSLRSVRQGGYCILADGNEPVTNVFKKG